jgi:NitT/TauT family transport system permease protein
VAVLSLIQLSGDSDASYALRSHALLLIVSSLLACSQTALRHVLFAVALAVSALWLAMLPFNGLSTLALALLAAVSVQRLASAPVPPAAVAALLGIWLLWFWQILVTGFAVPQVILPAPLDILTALVDGVSLLAGDLVQTVLKSVLAGYLLAAAQALAWRCLSTDFPFCNAGCCLSPA